MGTAIVFNVVETSNETEFDTVNQMLDKSSDTACSSSDWELCAFAREFYLKLAANGSSMEEAAMRTEVFREKLQSMWEDFCDLYPRKKSSINNISYERFGKLIEQFNTAYAGNYFLPLSAIPIIWKAYNITRVVMIEEDAFDEAIAFYDECKEEFEDELECVNDDDKSEEDDNGVW